MVMLVWGGLLAGLNCPVLLLNGMDGILIDGLSYRHAIESWMDQLVSLEVH